jgi:hypothetical protein
MIFVGEWFGPEHIDFQLAYFSPACWPVHTNLPTYVCLASVEAVLFCLHHGDWSVDVRSGTWRGVGSSRKRSWRWVQRCWPKGFVHPSLPVLTELKGTPRPFPESKGPTHEPGRPWWSSLMTDRANTGTMATSLHSLLDTGSALLFSLGVSAFTGGNERYVTLATVPSDGCIRRQFYVLVTWPLLTTAIDDPLLPALLLPSTSL